MWRAKGTNGTITFDGRTVTIERTGFVARTTVGKGTKSIPITNVVAVQWKPAGITAGMIQLTISGGSERRSRFGRQSIDAMGDENSVAFHVNRKRDFEAMRDALLHAIANPEPAVAAAPPPMQGPPAGWYPDPHGSGGNRWWDGTRWTEHTQAL